MSKELKKVFDTFEFAAKTDDNELRKLMLEYFARKPQYLKPFREICANIIKGNVRMRKSTKSKLSQHKDMICKIANCNLKSKNKKKLLVQSGGWIGMIIPLIKLIIDLVD